MPLVEYEQKGAIAYITLNRPEKLNAFSDDMSQELSNLLYRFYDEEEAMVCIISGNGRAFCSGADVKQRQLRPVEELKRLGGAAGRDGNIRQPFFKPPRAKPIIAAMHGYAYGVGIRIALYADMTVASKGTKFQVTEVVRGINGIPFWMMLTERGAGTFADDVCFTGRAWTAEEAFEAKVLSRLAEPGEHMKEAEKLAGEILKNPPLAVRAVIQARRSKLEEIDVKSHAISPRDLHLTEDFRESARSFVEKRPPVYKGR